MGDPTVVDLFCGVGGISKGFAKAGFRVLLGVDANNHVCEIFRKYNPGSKTIVDDIKNVNKERIYEEIGKTKVNVLVSGPPCQGFSVARKRNPADKRNLLFYEFVRIAKELRPSWIVMENVRGLASAIMPDGRKAIDAIYEAFGPEFKLKHYFVNAADFGVPQRRNRIIFVGNRLGIDFDFTMPSIKPKPVGRILSDRNKVGEKYFYSKKLIEGFMRREKLNRKNKVGFGWQFLKPDQTSFTIPARYYKDGANALIRYSKNDIRMLTEKECAKIQGLDARFFRTGKENYIAIGNAAPPAMLYPFAERIFSYGS